MDIVKTLELIEKNVVNLKRKFDVLDEEVENLKTTLKKFREKDEVHETKNEKETKNYFPEEPKEIQAEVKKKIDLKAKLRIFHVNRNCCVIMKPSDFKKLILDHNAYFYIFIKNEKMKPEILHKFCNLLGLNTQTSIFCFTRQQAKEIAEHMSDKGFPVSALFGGANKENERNEIMNKVQAGTCKMLTLTAGVVNITEGVHDFIQKSVIINLYQNQDMVSVKKMFGLDKHFKCRGFAVFTLQENNWKESFRFLKEFNDTQGYEIFRLLTTFEKDYCVVQI